MSEDTEVTLGELADRLAREAVKAEYARHNVSYRRNTGVNICECEAIWPCLTVQNLEAAHAAIEIAEEEEARLAAGPYHCGVQTRAARMYVDPEPAEYCENEVEHEGDLCAVHEGMDRADAEREDDDYERYKESRHDG